MRPIAIGGQLSSGKTSVAAELVRAHGYESRAFGDVVRREAVERGLDQTDRPTLQDLGAELVDQLGPDGMVIRLLTDAPTDRLVIEGVRHTSVLAELERRLPNLVFVFLVASEDAMDERWHRRGDVGSRDSAQLHDVEAEAERLRNLASLVVLTETFEPAVIAALLAAAAENASR